MLIKCKISWSVYNNKELQKKKKKKKKKKKIVT